MKGGKVQTARTLGKRDPQPAIKRGGPAKVSTKSVKPKGVR